MFTRTFIRDAVERAIKTFAQTLLALIGTAATTSVIAFNWPALLAVAATAALVSVLTSIVGAEARRGTETVSPASVAKTPKI